MGALGQGHSILLDGRPRHDRVVTGERASRIRRCQGVNCAIPFVDTSRPGTRRWCSMDRCGNREKWRHIVAAIDRRYEHDQRTSRAPHARRARQEPGVLHVAVVSGPVRTIYIGGQDAVTADGENVGKGDLAAQTTQILTTSRRRSPPPALARSTSSSGISCCSRGSRSRTNSRRSSGPGPSCPRLRLDHRGLRQCPWPPRLAGRDGRDRGRAGLTDAVKWRDGRDIGRTGEPASRPGGGPPRRRGSGR